MIERRLFRLTEAAVARPRATLLLALAAVLAAAPGLGRLELRTDGRALVAPGDPAVRLDAEVHARFGLRDPIVVLIETGDPAGIWNPATLGRVRDVTAALARLPGVGPEHVNSLATEKRDRVYPGTLDFRPFLDPPPTTPELVAEAREDVAAAAILDGTLVGLDGRSATVLVGVPPTPPDGGAGSDRTALVRRVEAAVAPFRDGAHRISVVGAPVAETRLGEHILADLKLLLPAAVLVLALATWVACRRPWPVALALGKVGACLAGVFGLMGWVGSPVRLTTAVLPVLLTTIGLCDEIHIYFRYQRRLALASGDGPHPAALLATMREMARPVALTALTTAIGFFALLASPLPAVRSLGLFAGLGILGCLAWALTVTPAALALLGPERLARPVAARPVGTWTARALAPLLARPAATLAVLGAVTLAAAAGLPRLHVQDSWIDGFAPGSPFRVATERADRALLGTHLLLVELTWPPATEPAGFERRGPLLDPAALRSIGAFEDFVRGLPGVGGVLGTHGQLTAVHYLWQARRDGMRSIPDEPLRVERLYERFEQARGEAKRREVVDDELRRALVTIFLEGANYRDTAAIMAAVRDYQRERFSPAGVELGFAGDIAVSQSMIPSIVETQVGSLGLALLGMALAVAVFWRSPTVGLWVLGPVSIGVLWALGGMGWAGVPLGVATSMFCAIALGLGDYSVHFVEEVRRARVAGAAEPALAAVAVTGPSIVADTLAIGAGFGLLAFSRVPANARLGTLVAVSLAASCVLTLAGLGSVVALVEKRRAGRAAAAARAGEAA